MLKGLTDAYRYLGNAHYLSLARQNACFLLNSMVQKDGSLWHNHKNGKSSITGYLEDYASCIDAFIGLYEVTLEEQWLQQAKDWTDYCLLQFRDPKSKLFFFTPKTDAYVIRRTIEKADNVIPGSNSIMANNLFKLGHLYATKNYSNIAKEMLLAVQENMSERPENYGHWMHLWLHINTPFYEVAVIGSEYLQKLKALQFHYLPNSLFCGAKKEGQLPLLQNRSQSGKTPIYICEEGSCKLPVADVQAALTQIQASAKD